MQYTPIRYARHYAQLFCLVTILIDSLFTDMVHGFIMGSRMIVLVLE